MKRRSSAAGFKILSVLAFAFVLAAATTASAADYELPAGQTDGNTTNLTITAPDTWDIYGTYTMGGHLIFSGSTLNVHDGGTLNWNSGLLIPRTDGVINIFSGATVDVDWIKIGNKDSIGGVVGNINMSGGTLTANAINSSYVGSKMIFNHTGGDIDVGIMGIGEYRYGDYATGNSSSAWTGEYTISGGSITADNLVIGGIWAVAQRSQHNGNCWQQCFNYRHQHGAL